MPRDHEVLVKVRATTVTIGDTIMRSFKLPNITGWQKFMARVILAMLNVKKRSSRAASTSTSMPIRTVVRKSNIC
jgi:hypothetical protein